jgi:hypothetical protein
MKIKRRMKQKERKKEVKMNGSKLVNHKKKNEIKLVKIK